MFGFFMTSLKGEWYFTASNQEYSKFDLELLEDVEIELRQAETTIYIVTS
jgi:hypothetical protein